MNAIWTYEDDIAFGRYAENSHRWPGVKPPPPGSVHHAGHPPHPAPVSGGTFGKVVDAVWRAVRRVL